MTHCAHCYYYLNPQATSTRIYKAKETHLYQALIAAFPNNPFTWDKKVDGGCSARRPDFRWESLTHSLIVECDEDQHTGSMGAYSQECENRRTMEIWIDLGSRPLVLIRFNPDRYIDQQGVRVGSCFTDSNSVVAAEWDRRIEVLKAEISRWLVEVPVKEGATQVNLFYSCEESGVDDDDEKKSVE